MHLLRTARWGLVVVCVASITSGVSGGATGERVEFKPVLAQGDTWRVEVSKMTERPSLPPEELVNWRPQPFSLVYELSVEAVEDVVAERCYRIRINTTSLNGVRIGDTVNGVTYGQAVEYWRMYLREADFTLKRVERLNAKTDQVQASHDFESGPVDATERVSILPLAMPSFREEATTAPGTRKNAGRELGSMPRGYCLQTEEAAKIRTGGVERDALVVKLEKAPEDSHLRVSTQTWVKGMPWWIEATYYRDGKIWCWARLLK
jgi:hypothetical protein